MNYKPKKVRKKDPFEPVRIPKVRIKYPKSGQGYIPSKTTKEKKKSPMEHYMISAGGMGTTRF